MTSNKPSKIVPPSGLRTPSPTKSRLPIGSGLPQRTTSVKGLQNISLQPTARKPSVRVQEVAKRPVAAKTRLQQSVAKSENQQPGTSSGSKVEEPPRTRNPTVQQAVIIKANSTYDLIYSRESLESRLELLHLHAIHKTSSISQRQWQDHACQHYKQKFEVLQKQSQELDQSEIEGLSQSNASAILSWSKQGNGMEKQIEALSNVVQEVEQFTSVGGRYTLAVQAFEHWIASMMSLQSQRAKRSDRLKVIEGLGDGWLAEVESLQTRLVAFADTMLGLVELDSGGSDLERTIATVSEMLKNMLEELDMILTLEVTIVEEEKHWMEKSIADITKDLNEGLTFR